jgi:beta-1,4-mannosyl-glycoprotein beta-1,4-N-acetylglucosaminyltransferase
MRLFIVILSILINVSCFATVRILTFHHNQADFIELQYKTLKKFLKDDFELIVFNDAKTVHHEEAIATICQNLGVQCVRFEQAWHLSDPLNLYLRTLVQDPSIGKIWGWHAETTVEDIASNPSVRHSHVIQYALDHYGYDHDDIVVIMDGDNFLIQPLSIRELLGDKDIIGFNQLSDDQGIGRKKGEFVAPKHLITPWVVFIAFCPNKLPNPRELQFHVDVVKVLPHLPPNYIRDTGGAIYRYLEKYPYLKVEMYPWQDSWMLHNYFRPQELQALGVKERLIQLIYDIAPSNVQLFLHEHFLHFSSASFERDDHAKKVEQVRRFILDIVGPPVSLSGYTPKIYDGFLFFNEVEILEIKLNELYDHVDHFVVVESAETFRGNDKPFYFLENQERFAKFLDKIIHIKLHERLQTSNPWDREVFQRNQILRGLTECHDDDIVIIEDLDEIVRASKLPEIVALLLTHQAQFVTCGQTIYTYFLNRQGHTGWSGEWLGSVAAKYRDVKEISPDGVRQKRSRESCIANAGWHFTYMGGISRVVQKLESFSHSELDYDAYKDPRRIRADVEGLRQIEIDATYPRFVQDNISYFARLGFIE